MNMMDKMNRVKLGTLWCEIKKVLTETLMDKLVNVVATVFRHVWILSVISMNTHYKY